MTPPTLTLYYDGLCPLCSREIAHYRRWAAGDPSVVFVDITDPAFDAAALGLNPERIHQVMHVREGDTLHTGIDAFRAVWRRIPGHGWMDRLARLPGVLPLMKVGYAAFARLRPYLPRRKRVCESGTCRR
jgi:predicted DCC family thiol-disulfide oxidoreductase YuxK